MARAEAKAKTTAAPTPEKRRGPARGAGGRGTLAHANLPSRRGPGEPINWDQAQREYVLGVFIDGRHIYPSFSDLGRLYGTNSTAVARRAEKEAWESKRSETLDKYRRESEQRVISRVVETYSIVTEALNAIARHALVHLADEGGNVTNDSLRAVQPDAVAAHLQNLEGVTTQLALLTGRPTAITETRAVGDGTAQGGAGASPARSLSTAALVALEAALVAVNSAPGRTDSPGTQTIDVQAER